MNKQILDLARETIAIEVEALQAMSKRLDQSFQCAVETILAARGRVVVIGIGKSGLVGQKIVATLASTGTPSFFVHAGEAFHGDLGMIKPADVAMLISNSGETEEVIRLLPFLQHQQNKVIAVTGKLDSTLAKNADIVLDIAVGREACTINLAPTSSTTATLVMGDALAVALTQLRNFQPEDFARFHPGGSLGRKLLTRVRDVMHRGVLPFCNPDTTYKEIIHAITRGRMGLAIVLNGQRLAGVITDGDIRRSLESYTNLTDLVAATIMTTAPITILDSERFSVAEEKMREAKINSLIVIDEEEQVVGILQIYDQQSIR